MSHRYESLLVHCVFFTKERGPLTREPMKHTLWAYICGCQNQQLQGCGRWRRPIMCDRNLQVKDTMRYIKSQEKHHAKISFAEEWRRILDRHGIAEFSR